MSTKFNEVLELIDSLSLEEQELLLEIETKKLIEKKRKILSEDIKEAQKEVENGEYITGDHKDVMRAIDDEVKSDKNI